RFEQLRRTAERVTVHAEGDRCRHADPFDRRPGAALWRRRWLLLRPWRGVGYTALRRRTARARADCLVDPLAHRQHRRWPRAPLRSGPRHPIGPFQVQMKRQTVTGGWRFRWSGGCHRLTVLPTRVIASPVLRLVRPTAASTLPTASSSRPAAFKSLLRVSV